MRNFVKKQNGITLIALVVTIIVLIILAGVSIAMLVGENGIITQAQRAKENAELAEQKEKEDMEKLEDEMNEYLEIIDWDDVLANAEKHPDQKISTAIGVGTDGKAVNMDIWMFAYDKTTDGYVLNSEETINNSDYGGDNVEMVLTSGYLGDITENGKIEGTIPTYISIDEGKTFNPVTSLYRTFQADCENNENLINLRVAPVIPETVVSMLKTFVSASNLENMPIIPASVTNMESTFYNCKNLTKVTTIPEKVFTLNCTFSGCSKLENSPEINSKILDNMYATFEECISLKTAPSIPNSVTNMYNTFGGCTSLRTAPVIPNSVTNMYNTFRGCTSLRTAPVIPNSVKVLVATFRGCSNLQGSIEINANVTGAQLGEEFYNNIDYYNCLLDATTNSDITLKVTGTCSVLQEIVDNANNPNISLE